MPRDTTANVFYHRCSVPLFTERGSFSTLTRVVACGRAHIRFVLFVCVFVVPSRVEKKKASARSSVRDEVHPRQPPVEEPGGGVRERGESTKRPPHQTPLAKNTDRHACFAWYRRRLVSGVCTPRECETRSRANTRVYVFAAKF